MELSKRDMGRIESASHLLKLGSSSPPSPPAFALLGNTDGKERHRVGRVSPLSEIPECNPNIEEKDSDPNHPSNRLLLGTTSPIDPINTLMENAFSLLFEPKSLDSLADMGEKETDESDDSDEDDGVIVSLEKSPQISAEEKKKILNEYNKAMGRCVSNQNEAEHVVPPDRLQAAESKNTHTVMVDPKKRSPSLSATQLLLMHSSSELEDPSGSSDPEKSGASSSGTGSSTDSVVVTQNICDTLSSEADSW